MKRTVSIILILVMAITIYIPMTAEHSYGASVRTTMPGLDSAEGKTYYYNKTILFMLTIWEERNIPPATSSM